MAALPAVGLCLALLAGCSPAPPQVSKPSSASEAGSADRNAGWLVKRIGVCFQNHTSHNLHYEFDKDTVTDQREWLAPNNTGTLGPNAFVCGASHNGGLNSETLDFTFRDDRNLGSIVGVSNTPAAFKLHVYVDRPPSNFSGQDAFDRDIIPGSPGTVTAEPFLLDVRTNGVLRTFDKIEAYPIDVRIYDATP